MSNNNQQNFYQGQNVLAEDLNNLQAYSDKNRNILVSDLLGSGILNGFEVTHKTDLTFSVSPGVAFDGNGNRLILEESTDVVLTKPVYIDGKSEPIKIRIKHSYIGSEPKKDSQDIETLTILTPSVEFITDETIKENLFQIATITLNENTDPLITRGEIFIALPDLTTTVSKNKVEIDSKVDDNTLAIATTNTEINKKVTDLTNTVATTNTAVAKNTSSVASNKSAIKVLEQKITYPINSTYTQYPNDTTGLFEETETPLTLFGGVWEIYKTVLIDDTPEYTYIDAFADFSEMREGVSARIYKYPSGKAVVFLTGEGIQVFYTVLLPNLSIFVNKENTFEIRDQFFVDYGEYQTGGSNLSVGLVPRNETRATMISNTSKGILIDQDGWSRNERLEFFYRDPSASYTPTTAEEKNYVKIWKRI